MTLGDVTANIVANTKGFTAGMNEVEGKLKKVGEGMQNVGRNMTKYVTLPILALGGGMAKAAMDLEATGAKYETVFKGFTEQADGFIAKYKELTPATLAEARSMASGIQDMLIPMGFARDAATDLTGEFMHVSGALANFNSGTHTSQQVTDAMNSALTGMYRPLKSLGVDVDATTVKLKAVEMGLADSTEEVDRQAEAQAVLALIYENSTDALDAYNEESLDAKTRMLLLKAEIIDIAAEFGESLLPMINKGIEFFKELAQKLRDLSPEQKEMILKIMGIVAALGPVIFFLGKVLIVLPKLAAGFALISGPIGWIIALLVGLTVGLVHLWKNNEEFRKKVIKAWNEIGDKFQEFMDSDFVKNAKRILGNIWDAIVVGAKAFGDTFSMMWDVIQGVYEEQLKNAFEELGEVFKKIFGEGAEESMGFSEILKTVGTIIAYVIGGIVVAFTLIITVIVKVITWFYNFYEKVRETVLNVWDSIKDAFDKVKEKFEEIAEAARQFWEDKVSPILESLKEGFAKVGEFFSWVWANILEPVLILMEAIFYRVVHEIGKAWNWLKDTVINPVMNWIKDKVEWATGKIQEAWEKVKDRLNIIWKWIKTNVLEPVGGWLTEKVVEPFMEVYDSVKGKMEDLKGKLKEIWDDIKKFFDDNYNSIKDAIVKPFNWAKETIEGIANSIKEAASKIDPRKKSSPSLVENVQKGLGQIMDEYQKLGDSMSFNPVAKSMLQGGDVLNIAINLDGANISSPEIAGEYAEQIGDAIIGKLRGSRRSYA